VDAENENTRTPQTNPCHQIHFNETDGVGWAQLRLEVLE
jgi:hypothetical protein